MTPDFAYVVAWFLTQPSIVMIICGSVTGFVIIFGLIFLLRKWGGYA